jgi:pyridoxamine 5'-phosphate oxidase
MECLRSMKNPFQNIRKQYAKGILSEGLIDQDPMKQLVTWLTEAINAEVAEPTAMVLSTTGKDLRPSSRVVLLKGVDDDGLVFYSNYESRKGLQMLENPQASLLFFWPNLERQIRIEGSVVIVSASESDQYFDSRPESSRLSAIISPQSRQVPDRSWLENQKRTLPETPLTRPAFWGGYRLHPNYFEFWQGREDRLHDRLIHQKTQSGWAVSRLAP